MYRKFLPILFVIALGAATSVSALAPYKPIQGGTGISTIPSYGQVLVGNGSGIYTLMATSSLGISGGGSAWATTTADYWLSQRSTSNLTEGTNLYFTTARATTSFIANLAATTSINSITALNNLGTVKTSLSGILKATAGVLSAATAGTDYESPLTFSYPLSRAVNTVSLLFGTTTANTWGALQTFNYSSSTNYSSFIAASSTKLFAGSLMVGTTTPDSPFEIRTETTGVPQKIMTLSGFMNATTQGIYQSFALHSIIGGSNTETARIGMRHDTAGQTGTLFFSTSNGSTPIERLTINQNGNIGIASTTPWGLLSVNAVFGTNNTLLFNVASSTSNATTTLFAIDKYGGIFTAATTSSTSTTIVLDWRATPPQIEYKIGTAATTITIINATTSQTFGSRKLVWICNPNATAGALTWQGVNWIGTAPTQTTTANQCDVYSFNITSGTSTLAAPTYKVAGTQGAGFQ